MSALAILGHLASDLAASAWRRVWFGKPTVERHYAPAFCPTCRVSLLVEGQGSCACRPRATCGHAVCAERR